MKLINKTALSAMIGLICAAAGQAQSDTAASAPIKAAATAASAAVAPAASAASAPKAIVAAPASSVPAAMPSASAASAPKAIVAAPASSVPAAMPSASPASAPKAMVATPATPAASAALPAVAVAAAAAPTAAAAPAAAAKPEAPKGLNYLNGKKGISDNVIRIGVLTDMSSIYALSAGPGAVVAARMAVEDFGKKEINGAKIEILSADDQNSTPVAAARAKAWFEKDKVDAIVGFVATTAAIGATAEGAKARKPVFVAGATSTGLTNAQCTPFTMHWMQDTYALSIGTVKGLIENGNKSFFFVTADYAFGWALEKDASEMVKNNGGEVKGAIRAPFPGADFTDQLNVAAASGAQVVAFANAGLDAVGTTLQANKLGMKQKQTIAPLLLFHQDVQSLGSEVLQNQIITTGFVWNQSPESIAFSRRYFARTHRMPDIGQAGVYSSVLQYLKAVEALGSDDGDEIMKHFKTPGTIINDAVIQNGQVRKDGRMMKPMYLIRIKKPGEMAHEWDFYDIQKAIKAEDAAIPLEKSTCAFINPPAAVTAPAAVGAPLVAPASAAKPAEPAKQPEAVKPSASSSAVAPVSMKPVEVPKPATSAASAPAKAPDVTKSAAPVTDAKPAASVTK